MTQCNIRYDTVQYLIPSFGSAMHVARIVSGAVHSVEMGRGGWGLSETKHLKDLGVDGMGGLVNAVTNKRVQ